MYIYIHLYLYSFVYLCIYIHIHVCIGFRAADFRLFAGTLLLVVALVGLLPNTETCLDVATTHQGLGRAEMHEEVDYLIGFRV